MNAHDDWARWSDNWQRQPAFDMAGLRRRAQWKLARMRAMVAVELLGTFVSTAYSLWMLWQPNLSLRWKAWAAVSLLLIAAVQALYLHVRRGTWRASSGTASDLLGLGRRRALAGIRLAKLNMWSLLLLIAATLLAAAPDLDPQIWRHDDQVRLIVIVQFAVNTPIVIATFAFFAWYIRRQRRRIAQLDALQLCDIA